MLRGDRLFKRWMNVRSYVLAFQRHTPPFLCLVRFLVNSPHLPHLPARMLQEVQSSGIKRTRDLKVNQDQPSSFLMVMMSGDLSQQYKTNTSPKLK